MSDAVRTDALTDQFAERRTAGITGDVVGVYEFDVSSLGTTDGTATRVKKSGVAIVAAVDPFNAQRYATPSPVLLRFSTSDDWMRVYPGTRIDVGRGFSEFWVKSELGAGVTYYSLHVVKDPTVRIAVPPPVPSKGYDPYVVGKYTFATTTNTNPTADTAQANVSSLGAMVYEVRVRVHADKGVTAGGYLDVKCGDNTLASVVAEYRLSVATTDTSADELWIPAVEIPSNGTIQCAWRGVTCATGAKVQTTLAYRRAL